MRSVYIIFGLLILGATANAQQSYDASLIPKNLLPYASAVVRNEDVSIEVKDLDNTTYHIKEAITVLNQNGDDMAQMVVWHNRSNIIKNIKGTVYNASGIPIGKFSEKDFEDAYAGEDFTLFEDSRVEHYRPSITDYPYTVEYEYEEKSKQSLDFDDWEPNPGLSTAVEKSSFTFTCKPDFNIKYKEINMPSGVTIGTTKDGSKTYSWQVTDLKAVKYEPNSPNPDKYLTRVKISPEKFEYEGIDGSYTDWNGLGKWMYDKLLMYRQQVSPETAQHILDMTANIPDPKLKAKKIYEYMQSKTRYVAISIGIGGFQPFTAADVDQQNYGDCKALVNYTQALLKIVGIDSYYCVVMGNHNRKISLLPDFASMNQANHIILCIPFKNDTTWCDCTSETIPFGYIGDFTDDRNVLACTPDGGKLLHTPKYTAGINLQQRSAAFIINNDGELSGDMTTNFKGVDYEDRDEEITQSPVERVKSIQNIYPINNMTVEKLQFTQDKSLQPVTTENISLKASEYAAVDDGKISFMPNAVNRYGEYQKQVINRVTDVYINEGWTEEDEITYTLPAGYHLDTEPLNKLMEHPFGSFKISMKMEGNKLIYKRRLQVIDGTYPKDTYSDFVDFMREVYDKDRYSLTLVKD